MGICGELFEFIVRKCVCVCVPETAVFQRKFTTQVGDNHQNSDEKGLLKWGSANVHNSLGKIEAATPGRTEGSPKSSLGGGTQIFFIFTPYFGKMHPIWQKKNQLGWFNHQLENLVHVCVVSFFRILLPRKRVGHMIQFHVSCHIFQGSKASH